MKGYYFVIEGMLYKMSDAKFEKYKSTMTEDTDWDYRLDWIKQNSKEIDSCFVYNY